MKRLRKLSLGALLRGRCPRCSEGPIFQPLFRGPLTMNRQCPVCSLVFEREAGYFLGAMYFSYTLGVFTVIPVALALLLAFHLSVGAVIGIALAQTLLMMVLSFRSSRVLWLYLDQALDPR